MLQKYCDSIMKFGPARVLINHHESTSSGRAYEEYGIVPDVIFIRNDGWSLGAPKELEPSAYNLWKDEWIGFVRRPNKAAEPIDNY